MKKIWMILCSLCLAVALTGCSAKPAAQAEEKTEVSVEAVTEESSEAIVEETVAVTSVEETVEESSEEVSEAQEELTTLVYKTGDLIIAMDAEATPILDVLGEADDYFEYTGCAGLGLMKYYYFSGIELGTYEDADGNDRIYSITFTNDISETAEGLCIGDSFDTAVEIYGAYGEAEEDLIVVIIDNTRLTILSEDGIVSSIQYLSKAASAKCN